MRHHLHSKVFKTLVISLTLAFTQLVPASAEPPPLAENILNLGPFENIFKFGSPCEGKSDLPHISRHVPGTVNVQARTTCAGKGVEITSRLTRSYKGIKSSVTKSNEGIGQTTVNVSMKCIWKKGAKRIRYEISSVHRLSDGQIGYTYNYADLAC